jgi:hypothetical protein
MVRNDTSVSKRELWFEFVTDVSAEVMGWLWHKTATGRKEMPDAEHR